MTGDGRDLAAAVDGPFDVAFSNSVIEHVGGWDDMLAFARGIMAAAPAFMVQTPSFWFPIEPHYGLPGAQWLPRGWRARLLTWMDCGHFRRQPDLRAAFAVVDGTRLLTGSQMRDLFPDARLVRERMGPFTKSYMAIREDGEL